MFPFAFGVPLASRHNSPAVTRSPPNPDNNPFNARPLAPGANGNQQETYAQKKANWKSSLRKPHPFMFREPQRSNDFSSSSESTSQESSSKRVSSSHRTLYTVRRILTVSLIILSIAIVITGVIYADKVTPANLARTQSAAPALVPGDTKTDNTAANEGELRARVGKRIDTAPFPEANPLDHTDLDSLSLGRLLAQAQAKAGSQPASVMAQLFFYVAALPIVTMIYACAELAIFAVLAQLPQCRTRGSPTLSSYDDDDSFCDSDAEDIDEEKFKHELAYPALPVSPEFKAPTKQQTISPRHKKLISVAPIVSIISSVLIMQGWTVLNGIQVHCEFISSGKNSKVCPAPLHADGLDKIHGLRQLSIARTALSWAVVLIYMVQIIITLKQYKLLSLRRFHRSKSGDAEASPNSSPAANRSPRSILNRNRSRSNSSRRKTVRFDLEEASRRQSEKGDDVQYIPAPSDGYDNGYGLTYNYSSNYAYAPNGAGSGGSDVRTPWQWQGQFEEFVNRTHTTHGLNTNPAVMATLDANKSSKDKSGSLNFGLASMRRLAREQNAALAHKTGFTPSQLYPSRNSHGLTSHPTIGVAIDHEEHPLPSSTSAVVPIALSTTAVPFKPKFVASQPAISSSITNTNKNDVVSPMTNGRRSIDHDAITEHGKRDVSPMSN